MLTYNLILNMHIESYYLALQMEVNKCYTINVEVDCILTYMNDVSRHL